MIPNITREYSKRINSIFTKRQTDALTTYRQRVEHLEISANLQNEKLLKITQQYVRDGFADYRSGSDLNWSSFAHEHKKGEREDVTIYLKQLAKELGRQWITVSMLAIRMPKGRKWAPLRAPFALVVQPYSFPRFDHVTRTYENPISPVMCNSAPSKFDMFHFSGEVGKQFHELCIQNMIENPECRKLLKTGEYLTGNK